MSTKNNIVGITSIEYDDSIKHVVTLDTKMRLDKFFDDKDNLIRQKFYKFDSHGKLVLIFDCEYTYDNNRCIKNISKDSSGNVTSMSVLEYNDNGNVVKNTVVSHANVIYYSDYKYDDNNRLIEELSFNKDNDLTLRRHYTYDDNTTAVITFIVHKGIEKLYCKNINCKTQGLNDVIITTDIYKHGDVSRETHIESVGDRLVKKYIVVNGVKTSSFKYDMCGNVTSCESISCDGSTITELYKFENVYNEAGDLILQIKQDLTGQEECLSAKDIIKYMGVN